MDNGQFRVIPGYEGYCVDEYGTIKSIERDIVLNTYLFNGYLIVDTFRGSLTETLPVHRAVALAWCDHPDPTVNIVVNHLDGNPLNNFRGNLEWTTVSGNNYHAVNNGLRSDNIECRVRIFGTGEVLEFKSISQAAEYMGLHKYAPMAALRLKKFGSLIMDQYEFRLNGDNTPWFYDGKSERVKPFRYLITVTEPDGTTIELTSHRQMLQRYQLYASASHSMPALVEYAAEMYPDLKFTIRDSYTEEFVRVTRAGKPSIRQSVIAVRGCERMEFTSLTQTAKHFNVDRSSILSRLENGKDLDGWTFT